MKATASHAQAPASFSRYQVFVIAILAFLQFTIILDFMILSPLGAFLMPALEITAKQFGLVVAGYAFSAGLSGFLASAFADRFDRKRLLLFFYAGFMVGTLLCALAPSYEWLLFARIFTGLFGGVIGAIVFAIMTDLFSYRQRGRVMGYVQTAFAASQVMGIPLGLFLANHWGWHAPFFLIVVASLPVGVLIMLYLKPIVGHLGLQVGRATFRQISQVLVEPRHLLCYGSMGLLMIGGFMLMPFSSAFSVNNLHIAMTDLPFVYMVTGFASIFFGPLAGKLTDTLGKFKVFATGSLITVVMVLIYTHLGPSSLALVMLVNVLMFGGITSRMISSQAMISAIPKPAQRGAFMAVSSSLQQISGGLASLVAGSIVTVHNTGALQNFTTVGYVVAISSFLAVIGMYFVNRAIREEQEGGAVSEQARAPEEATESLTA